MNIRLTVPEKELLTREAAKNGVSVRQLIKRAHAEYLASLRSEAENDAGDD